MKRLLLVMSILLAARPLSAQEPVADGSLAGEPLADAAQEEGVFRSQEAAGLSLDSFLWQNRMLIVFAESAANPAFAEQLRYLQARWPALLDRDVVVVTDTDPAAASALRQKLRPNGFMWVLIEKDGSIVMRKPFPWDVREISRAIDKLPLRRDEIRQRQGP